MSLQFYSKLWFLVIFQLRTPPFTTAIDYGQNSWWTSVGLDLEFEAGLRFGTGLFFGSGVGLGTELFEI